MGNITMDIVKKVKENLHLMDREIGAIIGRSEYSVQYIRRRILGINKQPHELQGAMKSVKNGMKKYSAGNFKIRRTPFNKRNVGDVYTIFMNGFNRSFIVTKDNRRYPYQRYLIEQHLGYSIPDDKIVIFKDRNPENLNIENLQIMTNADLLRRNHNPAKGNNTKFTRRMEMMQELIAYGISGRKNNP